MSEPVIPQCAACRVAGSNAHCDACPKTPWQEYASSEDGVREYAKAEPGRCGKCGYELPDQAPQIDYRPCGYCILLEQNEAQAAAIERLTEALFNARQKATEVVDTIVMYRHKYSERTYLDGAARVRNEVSTLIDAALEAK